MPTGVSIKGEINDVFEGTRRAIFMHDLDDLTLSPPLPDHQRAFPTSGLLAESPRIHRRNDVLGKSMTGLTRLHVSAWCSNLGGYIWQRPKTKFVAWYALTVVTNGKALATYLKWGRDGFEPSPIKTLWALPMPFKALPTPWDWI